MGRSLGSPYRCHPRSVPERFDDGVTRFAATSGYRQHVSVNIGRDASSASADRLRSVGAVVVITAVVLVLSQWWSGLDTPDSEFYATLAIFTDEITSRAPIDSYYWTRLGYVAPVHGLISLLGIWEGFAAFKAFLLLVLTASTFHLVRRFTGFWISAWLTLAAASSSIVVAYLGNPYVTGTVLAGTAATIALATQRSVGAAIGSGIALGWTAMAYPSGALLAGSLWVGLVLYTWRGHPRRPAARFALAAVAASLVTLVLFELAGRFLFPGMSWLGTYIEWSSFDHSRYSSGEHVWLRDISLLVPAAVAVLAVLHRLRAGSKPAADIPVIVTLTSIGFFLIYSIPHGEQFLEAPMLQAMLWPPALLSLTLIAASLIPDDGKLSPGLAVVAVAALALIFVSGFIDPNLPFLAGVGLAGAAVVFVLLSAQRALPALLAVSVFFISAQLLQNSRESLGQFPQDPYTWAYVSNPNEEKLRTAADAQQWLIDHTSRDDEILLWVDGPWFDGDRELYTVASMQLWGENLLTLSPTMDDLGSQRLEQFRPSVVAMYGKSMDAILDFWASLPASNRATAPECYDYSWPLDPTSDFPTQTGHTCITRLTW